MTEKRCNPFKDETEYNKWFNNNCDKCTVPKCYIKRAVKKWLSVKYITKKTCSVIGYNGSILNPECERFINVKKERINHEIKNIDEIFIDNCF